MLLRQGDPGLDTVHAAPLAAGALEALGMRDAASGDHPVDRARLDRLLGADAVAVHDLAFEKVGERGEADVGVRAHVHRARDARREVHRPHAVEEHERADHAALREGQHAPHFEAAKVAAPLLDHQVDHAFNLGLSWSIIGSMATTFDALIIGTGQAGPALAARLSGAGMKVAVVEKDKFGGTCVNDGCTPTKAMVASAYAAHMARRAGEYGVLVEANPHIDM